MTDTPQPEPEATPSTEVAKRETGIPSLIHSDDEIRRCWRLAEGLAASKVFSTSVVEQAFAKILIGRDLGISPTQALLTIDIVKGNIFMRGVLLASFVRKSPDYDYRILEQTDQKCRVMFYDRDPITRVWREAGESSFSMADAQKAGLATNDNYKKIPRNMLFYRAISNGVKFYCPDLLGGVPVYTEADPIPEARQLGAGTGNGQPEGIELPEAVEAVIARATELDNAVLSDRGAVEMATGDQPPEFVENWVREANDILDAMEDRAAIIETDAEEAGEKDA